MSLTTETIWNMFCCKLKPFIIKNGADPDVTDDIIQEVFIKIHEKIDTLKDETKVHSWVLQITKNTTIDYLRSHKLKSGIVEGIEPEGTNTPDSIIDGIKNKKERDLHNEITSSLRPLIESLPKKYSEALLLVEYEGMSQIDLAKKLQISPSGAKSRVQRARQMVKEQLLNCCHYEFDKYGTVIGVHSKICCSCNR